MFITLFFLCISSLFLFKNSISSILLSKKECFEHYIKYVQQSQNNNQNNEIVSFEDYLEYWWNLEESESELLDKVCKYIYNKYPKTLLRKNLKLKYNIV